MSRGSSASVENANFAKSPKPPTFKAQSHSPVRHGHLLQHRRASICLPVTRYGCSPTDELVSVASYVPSSPEEQQQRRRYVHVDFVVIADLLDSDVVLGVDEWLCGGVCLRESHDTGYVLELGVIIHLHLRPN